MNASGCKLEFWLDYLLCICAFITLDMCMHPALGWGWSPANEREQRVSNGVIPHNYPQPWKRSSMAVWTADRTGEKGSQPASPASPTPYLGGSKVSTPQHRLSGQSRICLTTLDLWKSR